MVLTSACPEVRQWLEFLRGELAEADALPLEQHLTACTACLQTVRGLRQEDTLADSIRARSTCPKEDVPQSVRFLIQQLKQWRPVSLSAPEMTADLSQSATPVTALAAEQLDFLAPPQGP